jgi:hypothetical protein
MRKIETGGGSYQQAELGIVAQQPAQVASAAELNRGIRHAGAFIPPRPVDPENARGFGVAPQAQQVQPQQQPAQRAPMPMIEDDNAFAADLRTRPAGLQLNPPVPPSGGKRRSPSLFDKIANMFSENEDEGDASAQHQGGNTGGSAQGGGMFSGFSARRPAASAPAVAAPQMQIMPEPQMQVHQQPAAPLAHQQALQNQQSDLEIPAFLRRQVS